MMTRITLTAMILLGLWSGGRLSYYQYKSGDACPILGETIPACYIAFAGYILIGIGACLALSIGGSSGKYIFWTGIVIAGGLAAFAAVFELLKRGVCPVGLGGIPMCYLSLAMSVLIGLQFWRITTDAPSKCLPLTK